MNKFLISFLLTLMLVLPVTAFTSTLSSNSPIQESSLSSSYVSTAPSIDGSIGFGEWQLVDGLDFPQ